MSLEDISSTISDVCSSCWDYIKDFFAPPKSWDEYYAIGKFIISKKLVKIIFIILSLISVVYLLIVLPEKIIEFSNNKNSNKVYTKYYTSRSLKNYSGVAKVVSKKNKAEYLGEVVDGIANGKGTLYSKYGNVVYIGDFVNNEYSGEGSLYYKNGILNYVGSFESNKFSGEGKLYYNNGKLNYYGEFANGFKNGNGTLYNNLGLEIFNGIFNNDYPAIEKLLNGSVDKLENSFLEDGIIYNCNNETSVIYKNLGVMVFSNMNADNLNMNGVIEKIYIFNNKYFLKEPKLVKNELDKKFVDLNGTRGYSGYTKVFFPEMGLIDYLRKLNKDKYSNFCEYNFDNKYSDVLELVDISSKDKLYVQAYEYNNLGYTFYFINKDEKYVFYSIERLS